LLGRDASAIINYVEHRAGDVGSIFAGATARSLIGALYLWPVGFAVCKKINNLLPIVLAVVAALAVLVITLVAIPALLPINTSAFAIASAGTSAIAVAKAI
jgi:hypothetical protein